MDRIRRIRLKPLLLLAAAMMLRALIPAGYMPAAAGSGLWFEFCPEGVPAGFMQLVSGDEGHGHHHGEHADNGHQCPIGHMLTSAAAVDDAWQTEVAATIPARVALSNYSYTSISRNHYRSRGPPA